MDIMIDIETLSTRSDAAILSIGAVKFDLATGAVSDPFLVSIDPTSYDEQQMFDIDNDTVAWWKKQGKTAQKALEINRVATVFLALDRLIEYFEDNGFDAKDNESHVWARGPQFDLTILRHAARMAYGKESDAPWMFYQERDVRTFLDAKGYQRWSKLPASCDDLIAHRADHDAIKQAYEMLEATKP